MKSYIKGKFSKSLFMSDNGYVVGLFKVKETDKINKEFIKSGGIGSGYPSDPKTKEFLSNYTYDEMPDFVRRSWATVAKLK